VAFTGIFPLNYVGSSVPRLSWTQYETGGIAVFARNTTDVQVHCNNDMSRDCCQGIGHFDSSCLVGKEFARDIRAIFLYTYV
jgi:hypothetical protein